LFRLLDVAHPDAREGGQCGFNIDLIAL